MLGFRLEKETIISRDVLTASIAFVLMLLFAIYFDNRNASSSLDDICSYSLGNTLLFIIFGTISAFCIAYMVVCLLGLFCSRLFDAYYIKYYISDTLDSLVEYTDDEYLKMICSGAIPFIDDEYIDELDYTVKCVKVDFNEYGLLHRMINNKKRMEEQERLAYTREKYENSKLFKKSKIYLGV